MRVYAWNVAVQVQILSPHPLTPSSCLRTECIPTTPSLTAAGAATPSSCLRTECITIMATKDAMAVHSQLMSPHGMHRSQCGTLAISFSSQLMSPHGMHRFRYLRFTTYTISQLMSPHGMHHAFRRARRFSAILPTHVSARNASTRRPTTRKCASAPNSCLRTECIGISIFTARTGTAPNSCLRTECI